MLVTAVSLLNLHEDESSKPSAWIPVGWLPVYNTQTVSLLRVGVPGWMGWEDQGIQGPSVGRRNRGGGTVSVQSDYDRINPFQQKKIVVQLAIGIAVCNATLEQPQSQRRRDHYGLCKGCRWRSCYIGWRRLSSVLNISTLSLTNTVLLVSVALQAPPVVKIQQQENRDFCNCDEEQLCALIRGERAEEHWPELAWAAKLPGSTTQWRFWKAPLQSYETSWQLAGLTVKYRMDTCKYGMNIITWRWTMLTLLNPQNRTKTRHGVTLVLRKSLRTGKLFGCQT